MGKHDFHNLSTFLHFLTQLPVRFRKKTQLPVRFRTKNAVTRPFRAKRRSYPSVPTQLPVRSNAVTRPFPSVDKCRKARHGKALRGIAKMV